MQTNWNYSDRAHTYDKRADYSELAVDKAVNHTGLEFNSEICDIGAGTGKLTKILQKYFKVIFAVEPNENMRQYGEKNVTSASVYWSEGTAESTGISSSSVDGVFFGSSFNVVDHNLALKEVHRITKKNGWFTCMWNHRDINDPIQNSIEALIRTKIPSFNYGSRRESPVDVLNSSGLFGNISFFEERFEVPMSKQVAVDAWKSHDTLFRQSNGNFDEIISNIADLIPDSGTVVPYFTRIWVSQLKA